VETVDDRTRVGRYFITFSCYGTRLHGDEKGSVDPSHNMFGSRSLQPDLKRFQREKLLMKSAAFEMAEDERLVVLEAIRSHCLFRDWNLLAAHVRTNHVHVIVEAKAAPERVMNEFKSYATRELKRVGGNDDQKRWARHGSTRWLWDDRDVREAMQYVCEEQGEVMALYVAPDW